MSISDGKIDPIRTAYYRPVQTAELFSRVLFYVSSGLSILVLLVDKRAYPRLYDFSQVAFLITTVVMFFASIGVRLYFSPRGRNARLADFLSNALGAGLTHERTSKYYNNEETDSFRKMGAQLLENTYFTRELIRSMCKDERVVAGVLFVAWLVTIVDRASPLDLVVGCTLVLFGEELISRLLRIEWFRDQVERIHSDLFRCFQSGHTTDSSFTAAVIEALVLYENSKASSGITISSRLFDRRNADLTKEWERIRNTLNK